MIGNPKNHRERNFKPKQWIGNFVNFFHPPYWIRHLEFLECSKSNFRFVIGYPKKPRERNFKQKQWIGNFVSFCHPPSLIFRIFKIWPQIRDRGPQKPPRKKFQAKIKEILWISVIRHIGYAILNFQAWDP